MRNVCLYISILLSYLSYAQDPNNHWQIGSLNFDFSTNPPQISTIGQGTPQYNGGAAISDVNGDLLFYFNEGYNELGDRNHNYLSSLFYEPGGLPCGRNSIILPHPGDINKFYIFWGNYHQTLCVGCTDHSWYMYSIVDFTNNTLGEVVEFNNIVGQYDSSIARVLRDDTGTEIDNDGNQRAITYCKNASETGYWVIVEFEGKIFSFLVDGNGVSLVPVLSYSSTIWQGDNSIMKIAPDYSNPSVTKLYTSSTGNHINSFDFNRSTGELSNHQQISLGSYYEGGFELSPDNSKIYVVSGQHNIIVKDLTSLSTPPRVLNEYQNPSIQATGFAFLQKDKYGNILVGGYEYGNKANYIHKINNPDSFQNSTVELNYVYLNGEKIASFPQLLPPTEYLISCIDNITLSTNEINNNYTYEVDNIITTENNYSVNSGRTITYKAGQAVVFKPNTHLKSGSVVHAKIEECILSEGRPSKLVHKSWEKATQNFELADSLIIYPNPATSSANIELKNDSMKNVILTSIDGKIIFSSIAKGQTFELNVENYMPGIYVITIETEDGKVFTEKLIKK